MEEILIVVLQILLEFVLQLVFYAGLDFSAWSINRDDKSSRATRRLRTAVIRLFLPRQGRCSSWIAPTLVDPRVVLPHQWLRIANPIVAPLGAAGISWLFADWRRRRGAAVTPSVHFFRAFWFVLGFDVVRFIYAER